jgi:hypothetical protein
MNSRAEDTLKLQPAHTDVTAQAVDITNPGLYKSSERRGFVPAALAKTTTLLL